VFESHPLTICNAPATISNIRSSAGQLLLAARVNGDWTRAINQLAHASNADDTCCGEKSEPNPVVVMLDGPYGGVSFDLGRYEHVLLVAGGAGITFILGVLDDLVGKIAKLGRRSGERTTKIEFAWCIKSFGKLNYTLTST
jgi:predicted ferric reductase